MKEGRRKAVLTVSRGGEKIVLEITPAVDAMGAKKLGLFVRSAVNGIGTITYIDLKLNFGLARTSRPHGGRSFAGSVRRKGLCLQHHRLRKGGTGRPGELRGLFLRDKSIGTIEKNTRTGVYGVLDEGHGMALNRIKVAKEGAAKVGEAKIYTTIDGVTPKEYRISIVKVDQANPDNKNLVIKITDKDLLENTGGILQGMSGSPIVHGRRADRRRNARIC